LTAERVVFMDSRGQDGGYQQAAPGAPGEDMMDEDDIPF
jgi:hypothetical protein